LILGVVTTASLGYLLTGFSTPAASEAPSVTEIPAGDTRDPAVPSVTLETAQVTLLEADPDLYRLLQDRDAPLVDVSEGITTYTWHYVDTEGDAELTKAISLMFDASGMIAGARRD
jgi:hypothetical protein